MRWGGPDRVFISLLLTQECWGVTSSATCSPQPRPCPQICAQPPHTDTTDNTPPTSTLQVPGDMAHFTTEPPSYNVLKCNTLEDNCDSQWSLMSPLPTAYPIILLQAYLYNSKHIFDKLALSATSYRTYRNPSPHVLMTQCLCVI